MSILCCSAISLQCHIVPDWLHVTAGFSPKFERRRQPIKIEITGTANSIDAFLRNNLERIDDAPMFTATKQQRMDVRLFPRAIADAE
jgi:hypothetical protein